ncbi:MAG: tyrosine--tRNA ligase [Deltaproteobacteria bacterium]
MMSAQEQLAELKRGTSEILSEKDLLSKLEKSIQKQQPLIIKAGFDPTAPDIHLGHTVLMQKMAQFQRLGHQVVFLIGDFTAMVGDPSGKSKTRPQLSQAEILANVETYKKQVYKILDPQKTIIRFNSEWLNAFKAHDFIRLASHANVARMLEREDFNRRYKEGQSISLHEFIYPLLQAFDSVALKADVELGGTDQKFNLLMGRELMRDHQLEPQVCLMMPLLEGLDGVQKMSKSLNNYVGVDESPNEIYGKLMSLPDSLLRRYYDLLSARPLSEVDALFAKMQSGEVNPKWVKSDLAVEIVTHYHSAQSAQAALQHFENVFSKKEIPEDIPEISFPDSEEVWIPKLLVTLKFAATTSEGKRLVSQGGVKIDETPIKEEKLFNMNGKTIILQCGKRKFAKVKF